VRVRIYVEGGFEGQTKTTCRKAFRVFFEKVVPHGSISVIASGDRATAYRDFCVALKQHPNDFVILLVDSEEAVLHPVWEHLQLRPGDHWARPAGAQEDQVHLMVQVMESWFLADPSALGAFYGQHFHRKAIPGQANVELISKADVYSALENATKNTQKGRYHKTRHAFELMELLDPARIRAASVHANELMKTLTEKTA
jgi:hypothetical protein